MSWPDSRICTGCKKIFDRDNCKIDIGDFWNNSDDMIFACSEKCASDAKNNWLKPQKVLDISA